MRSPDIEVSSLEFAYSSEGGGIFSELTFSVGKGETCCILGPSGCGKTTLLRLIAGELKPCQGTVHVGGGRGVESYAFIPQSAPLLPWRTVLQNVTLGLELRGPVQAGQLEYVRELLAEYYLEGAENLKPAELSGGMRQRTAIIRALASKPRLLLCDEPFSAIDFVSRLALLTKFKKVCRLAAATVLFVTHNIEDAIFLGDEVLVLGGRPARIVTRYTPHLTVHPEDAVECRSSPEFENLFRQIWSDLDGIQNSTASGSGGHSLGIVGNVGELG